MFLRAGVVVVWLLFAAFAVCALLNSQAVPFAVFGAQVQSPLNVVLILALAVGIVAGYSLDFLKRPQAASEKKQLEWAAQDAKLIAEVKSDREKQLEAKIATLETALKQALAKNKA